ncbi:hypothetical protein E1287_13655 [Actinomadura sp. KC06]|uniref:carotenoid oxygenase family protein n=1 Tax=Actinomadura sp. KC06 TaxID=2530369 RepID=UPI00104BF94A|nr:carotenoid oxygenase family protein [Actinomadura sp. KC06]TDD35519.1 hypothetical protein E1287_13655 [Actinomadura sp. KC06]
MATATRSAGPRTALAAAAIGRSTADEPLPVAGTLPEWLDGAFVQAARHPAASGPVGRASAGPHAFSGVRVTARGARWLRERLPVRHGAPLGPLPALAPSLWNADLGPPDGPGAASLARPVREGGSDLWHTVAAYPGMGHAEHLIADGDGTVLHAEPFPLGGAPLLHAAAVTRRHLVVLDLPVAYSRAAALVGARSPYVWRPERPARIGLLPRWSPGAAPRWFRVTSCYVFRAVNAYEDGERVVLDGIRHERAFDAGPAPAAETPRLQRWVLDGATGAVREEVLADGLDDAVVDGRVCGSRHRVVFGSVHAGAGGGAVVRHDLETGRVRRVPFGPGWTAGQPVFVPGGRDVAEGAGVLLVAARHAGTRRCELRVLDAAAPDEPPPAVVRLPVELPTDRPTAWI